MSVLALKMFVVISKLLEEFVIAGHHIIDGICCIDGLYVVVHQREAYMKL
jgi:hypothetical protein